MENVLTLVSLNIRRKPVQLEKFRRKWLHLVDVPIQPSESKSVKILIEMDNQALH